ncbi:hypothetical protein PG985_004844 [Apiospora marii]|uniref:uncharacterized protein n=1 Tax=Apiospora marii TaxID=335849 RepID=UPI00312CED91
MGRLIKTQLARLVVLSAAAYHFLATAQAFLWPKVFWGFLTTALDGSVVPVLILQIANLLCALAMLALEWPAPALTALLTILLYQATNAALCYLLRMGLYAWGYSSWETIYAPGGRALEHMVSERGGALVLRAPRLETNRGSDSLPSSFASPRDG